MPNFNMKKFLFALIVLCTCLFGCKSRPKLVWRFETQAPIYASPSIYKDTVIVGSNDHHLYAVDAQTGKLHWKRDLGERVFMKPLIEANLIYVGSASGYFYQINADNGGVNWRFKTEAALESELCSDSQGIYFGSDDGNFYKINRQGALIWKYKTGFKVTSSCSFENDLVFTSSWDYNIYGIQRDSGKMVWKVPTGEFAYGGPAVYNGAVFYGTHEELYKVDAKSGKLLFKVKAAYHHWVTPYNNYLYTQESGITKRTLDGKVVKNVTFDPNFEFAPAIVNDYIVYADNKDTLYGISQDLEVMWKYRSKNIFWSPGALHNGIYYIGNRDGNLYALKLPR
jgi:eukaryotic-like serine/threonine-protein kinase